MFFNRKKKEYPVDKAFKTMENNTLKYEEDILYWKENDRITLTVAEIEDSTVTINMRVMIMWLPENKDFPTEEEQETYMKLAEEFFNKQGKSVIFLTHNK